MRHTIPKEIKTKRKLINFLYVYDLVVLFSVFLFNNYVITLFIHKTLSLVTLILLEAFTVFMLTPSPINKHKRRWQTYTYLFSSILTQNVYCILPQKRKKKQEKHANAKSNQKSQVDIKRLEILGR